MNNGETLQLLIGQVAADALVRDALLIALMEVIPDLHARLESKVAVTAPGVRWQLPTTALEEFDTRLAEVLGLMRGAAT